ncbi:hypothetical protein DSO57_1010150 [Entomophthora muscae]|uniref:Uncharacterized protein n=1 Tax=Entomophthora muscae TaxID=34485 RepID=A0ACC2THH5_9FUNG|nr:hypothetical protein DSO57_1010150 [Entomophthora muscae]
MPTVLFLLVVPYGLVHLIKYSLKPGFEGYTTEEILAIDPLACTKELTYCDNKNTLLHVYLLGMEPPPIIKLMHVSVTDLPLDNSNFIRDAGLSDPGLDFKPHLGDGFL